MKIWKTIIALTLTFLAISCSAKKDHRNSSVSITNQKENIAVKSGVQPPETQKLVNQEISGKFIDMNEEGDYWKFIIQDSLKDTIEFIYNSQEILNKKDTYTGKILIVRYKEKEFVEAGSGDKFMAKELQSVEIQ